MEEEMHTFAFWLHTRTVAGNSVRGAHGARAARRGTCIRERAFLLRICFARFEVGDLVLCL
jgi:hypothetical protein